MESTSRSERSSEPTARSRGRLGLSRRVKRRRKVRHVEPPAVTFPSRLDGRVAIVTGASSGVGARFTHVLHAAGAAVVAAARRTDRLEALAADLGDRVLPVTADISDDK